MFLFFVFFVGGGGGAPKMHLKKHWLQNHIAALDCQPRRLPALMALFLCLCVCCCCCCFFHNLACNCNQAAFGLFVVLFLRSSAGARQTHPGPPPQIKGCGHVRSAAAFLVPGRDNRTVCGTHVPQQSTEQPFEEAPSHGRCGLDTIRHSVTPASPRRTFTSVNSHCHCGCGSATFIFCVCVTQTSKYEKL